MAVNKVAFCLLLGVAAGTFLLTGCDAPGAPGPPPLSPDEVMDFHTLFTDHCQGCHGVDGKGAAVQRLNDPMYLSIVPKQEILYTVTNGRPGTLMPAFSKKRGGPLTEKQIDALVDGIEANWGKPRVDAKTLPPYFAQGPGDPKNGEQVFKKACSMCHGSTEHPGPIGPITIPTFLSLISDQDIRTIVIIGRTNTGMPNYRQHALGRPMTNQEITDVVAYLSSLRPTRLPGVPTGLEAALAHPPYGVTSGAAVQNPGDLTHPTGSGNTGPITSGNKGSGHGPGSRTHGKGPQGHKRVHSSIVGGK